MSKKKVEEEKTLEKQEEVVTSDEVVGSEFLPRELSPVELLQQTSPKLVENMINVLNEQLYLLARKNMDYGLYNVTGGKEVTSEEEWKFALTGIWHRVNDKVNRWKNLVINGNNAVNESILDTFQDIANYAIIAQLITRGLWRNE